MKTMQWYIQKKQASWQATNHLETLPKNALTYLIFFYDQLIIL